MKTKFCENDSIRKELKTLFFEMRLKLIVNESIKADQNTGGALLDFCMRNEDCYALGILHFVCNIYSP